MYLVFRNIEPRNRLIWRILCTFDSKLKLIRKLKIELNKMSVNSSFVLFIWLYSLIWSYNFFLFFKRYNLSYVETHKVFPKVIILFLNKTKSRQQSSMNDAIAGILNKTMNSYYATHWLPFISLNYLQEDSLSESWKLSAFESSLLFILQWL